MIIIILLTGTYQHTHYEFFIRNRAYVWDWLCFQAGIAAAPARAVSAVKEMNIPQRIKDIKLPDLPSIGNLISK